MTHRVPALDGLRALACGGVVLFHCQVPGLGGGWLGVDVFFVLSGYLITGLLLAEQDGQKRISLGAFWARRAVRLYPALLVTVALGIPFAGTLGNRALGYQSTAAVALTFTTDFYLVVRHNNGGGLAHAWSLAVEEQFYLVWPLVVAMVRRRSVLLIATVAAASASFASMALDHRTFSPGFALAYFAPWARAWELLAGAILAAAAPTLGRGHAVTASTAGALGILAATAGATPADLAPAILPWRTLAVVLASTAFLAGASHGPAARLFSSAPMVWVGRRSYAIYLLHVPAIAVVTKYYTLSQPVSTLVVLLFTVLMAALSYRLVEQPAQSAVRTWLAVRTRAADSPRRDPPGSRRLHDRRRASIRSGT